MDDTSFPPTSPEELASRIESGEYFHEARNIYAARYLDPIAERYFYLLVSILAGIALLLSGTALLALMPLKTPSPFTYISASAVDELPVMRSIGGHGSANAALIRYLVSEYILRREEYDIDRLEQNARFIRAQSEPAVFNAWQNTLDPSNPESPISRYQRQAVRKIDIISARPSGDGMDVVYDATVQGRQEKKSARFTAHVAFTYQDVTVDQETGKATPLQFTVTQYTTRGIEE